ncbi:MAG: LysR substrate-binding domain-containing protein [bacterium]
MDSASEMGLFAQVVEANGFKAAGQRLGLSPSAVSKRISRLEDRLGARLLHRTTRSLALTEVGAVYFEHCRRILDEIAEAEREVADTMAVARGHLRVSVPLAFGPARIAPILPEFLEHYPQVRVSVVALDRDVDLIGEGFDVAIRVARLRDSSLIARRLTSNRRVVCATAGYFAKYGTPRHPPDLDGHNCLVNTVYSPQGAWSFKKGAGLHSVQVRGNLELTSPQALREVALRGLGIGLLPAFLVDADLRAGRLLAVLTDYVSEDADVFLIYPHSRHLSPKVRVFVDFLADRFKDDP